MKNWINVYLGEKLKFMRENKNKKQEEMALIFGMKQQNYSKLELGKTHFSNKILAKINEVFDVTPIDFLTKPISERKIITTPNINYVDDYTTRIIIASQRKQIAELQLQIINLEIELMHHKPNIILKENTPPIYVMI